MLRIFLSGIGSGILMALFLRVVEQTTGDKVYTLLLNVDYVPFIHVVTGIEVLEFSLHMIVAVVLSIFVSLFVLKKIRQKNQQYVAVILISLIIGVLLFPSTMFSHRTPSIDDVSAWFWWLLSHILYGYLLTFMLLLKRK